MLLEYLINFVADPSQPAWNGYAYAVGMFVASTLQTIFVHQVCDGMLS